MYVKTVYSHKGLLSDVHYSTSQEFQRLFAISILIYFNFCKLSYRLIDFDAHIFEKDKRRYK